MTYYKSKSGKQSGVTAYQTGSDSILVQFNHTTVYKYSYKSCGKAVINTLKKLALASEGLGTFISQNDPPYEWKR